MRTLLALLAVVTLASPLRAADDKTFDWFTFYYLHPQPERFVEEVRKLGKAGYLEKESAQPPTMAFLSRVMAQNPKLIEQWLTALQGLPPKELNVLYSAAWYSNTPEARRVFEVKGLKEYMKPPPDILAMDITSPDVLDMLWGYFLATGEKQPVRRIVSALEDYKYSGAIERYKSSDKTEKDKADAYKDSIFQAARWSLASNCQQHARVKAFCVAIFAGKDLDPDERLWLNAILVKVDPEHYKLPLKTNASPDAAEPAGDKTKMEEAKKGS